MGFHKDLPYPPIHPKWNYLLVLSYSYPTVIAPWAHSARHFPGAEPQELWGSGRWRNPCSLPQYPPVQTGEINAAPRSYRGGSSQGLAEVRASGGQLFIVLVVKWPWSVHPCHSTVSVQQDLAPHLCVPSTQRWTNRAAKELVHELLTSLQVVPLILTVCSRMYFLGFRVQTK